MTAEAGLIGPFLSRYPRPYSGSLGVLGTEARQATGRASAHLVRLHHRPEPAVALPGGVDELRQRMAYVWTRP